MSYMEKNEQFNSGILYWKKKNKYQPKIGHFFLKLHLYKIGRKAFQFSFY